MAINLFIEPRTKYSWEEFKEQKEPYSIALDGIVRHPTIRDLEGPLSGKKRSCNEYQFPIKVRQHKPVILKKPPEGRVEAVYGGAVHHWEHILKPDCRYIINVGSLGQPRDGIPSPCFVVFDSDQLSVEFRRYDYDIQRTQEKIRSNQLPSFLSERLSAGF